MNRVLGGGGGNYVETGYADLRRSRRSPREQRAEVRILRAGHQPCLSREPVLKAIGKIVEQDWAAT